MIEKLRQRDENDIFVYTYNEGVAAFNCEDYKIALSKFLEAKNLPAPKAKVLFNIALCYQNLNDMESAIKILEEYIEQKPFAYNALENLFFLYYDLSDYKNAVKYFIRCIKIHKEETMDSYINSKQFNANSEYALKFFNNILYTEDGKYLYMDLLKYLEKERVTLNQTVSMGMVIDMYKQYRDYTNDKEETEISISRCYAKMNNWDKAIYHAQKAVVVNPESYEANKQLGFVYYCCSQYDKSIDFYKKAIELAPNLDYKLHSNLAYAYEKARKLPEAVRQFEVLLDKFKNIPAFFEIKYHTEYVKSLIEQDK